MTTTPSQPALPDTQTVAQNSDKDGLTDFLGKCGLKIDEKTGKFDMQNLNIMNLIQGVIAMFTGSDGGFTMGADLFKKPENYTALDATTSKPVDPAPAQPALAQEQSLVNNGMVRPAAPSIGAPA